MYGWAGKYYDSLYASKDYEREAGELADLIRARHAGAESLLDVACGTGAHLQHLARSFQVEGLDLSRELVDVARERLPDVPIHVGDMVRFDLRRRFDAVICMFSSIGYARTAARLGRAIRCMAGHLNGNGVLVVEPWFTEETWRPRPVYATFVDEPAVKIARISTNRTRGRTSIVHMEYLVGTEKGVRHLKERHVMGLFSRTEMMDAFESAGLRCEYQEPGVAGKGHYVAQRIGD